MRRSNFALRLQPSLMEEARKAAEAEGVALNQLINVAVAEKLSMLRTQEYFQDRASRANRANTLRILDKAGREWETAPEDKILRAPNNSTEKRAIRPRGKTRAAKTDPDGRK